jgi:molybdenum cofactor cytidylyltransferase
MGTAKALLAYRGETFLDRLIGLFEPLCSQVIVVLGHDADRIRAGLRRDAEFVLNPDPARGQLTSLQCGLLAVSREADAVFFTPVDYPAIQPSTVTLLLEAFSDNDAVVPRHAGRRGHPVLVSTRLLPRFLELSPDRSARDVMHAASERTRYVDVDDPGILRDVDDLKAYEELTA